MQEALVMARKHVPDRLVCETAVEMHFDTDLPRANLIERLMAKTGECEKVCYSAAYRSAGRGLIDYGVSVRQAWVTPEGEALIEAAKGPSSN